MQAVKGVFLFWVSVLVLVLSTTLLGVRVKLPEETYAATEHEYRSVFVSAPMKEDEGNPGWKQIDEKEFVEDLRFALNQLSYEGFEVVEVTPVIRGRLDTGGIRHGTWGGGYGVTQGVVIIAKKSSE